MTDHSSPLHSSSPVSLADSSSLKTPASSSSSVRKTKPSPLDFKYMSPTLTTKPITEIPFSIGGPAHSQALEALMQHVVCEGCE